MTYHSPHFGTFLLYLLLMLVVMPILYGVLAIDRILDIFVWGMLVVGAWALFPSKKGRIAAGILITTMLLLHLTLIHRFNFYLQIIWIILHILFAVLMLHATGKYVFKAQFIDRNIIAAATCFYLIFGILMALFYHLIYVLDPNAFVGRFTEGSIDPHVGGHLITFLYFSFVTLTTLGYGDIEPINAAARSLSAAEAMTGQLFIAIILAHLISRQVHTETHDKNH